MHRNSLLKCLAFPATLPPKPIPLKESSIWLSTTFPSKNHLQASKSAQGRSLTAQTVRGPHLAMRSTGIRFMTLGSKVSMPWLKDKDFAVRLQSTRLQALLFGFQTKKEISDKEKSHEGRLSSSSSSVFYCTGWHPLRQVTGLSAGRGSTLPRPWGAHHIGHIPQACVYYGAVWPYLVASSSFSSFLAAR